MDTDIDPNTVVDNDIDKISNFLDTSINEVAQNDTLSVDLGINYDALASTPTTTIEEKVMEYLELNTPHDRFFLRWQTIHDNGELYISNYKSTEYQDYKYKVRMLFSKYYNPKKYTIHIDHTTISAYNIDKHDNTNEGKPITSIDKPRFINVKYMLDKTYNAIKYLKNKLSGEYAFLSKKPYISPIEKQKFIKQRELFIKKINEYYTYMYYYNRINNLVMTHNKLTISYLPIVPQYYSEKNNTILPRIDKVTIQISQDNITKKYQNESAKLELYNKIQQNLKLTTTSKDKQLQTETRELLKEYIEFDARYQSDLVKLINRKKHKQLICDIVIFTDQPLPGTIGDDNLSMAEAILSNIEQSNNTADTRKVMTGGSTVYDDMEESDRKRKFYFINRARSQNK